MLNLTPDKITLLAESGETTEIRASGYVARVEFARRNVNAIRHTICDPKNETCRKHIPIIEETPTEIVVTDSAYGNAIPNVEEAFANAEGGELFLVTREVAEAAHALGHPLWRRMAWADDGIPQEYWYCLSPCDEFTPFNGSAHCPQCGKMRLSGESERRIHYRALRRVPQGENDA